MNYIHFIFVVMKGKKDYPTYNYNPSVAALSLDGLSHSRKAIIGKPFDVVSSEGEPYTMQKHDLSSEFTIVDSKPFLKVYRDIKLGDLSKPSLMILDFMFTKIKPKKDTVHIDARECMLFCGWEANSRANFYKGIEGLLANEIIFNMVGSGSEYYINVIKLFNGDRRVPYSKVFLGKDKEEYNSAIEANEAYKRSKVEDVIKLKG